MKAFEAIRYATPPIWGLHFLSCRGKHDFGKHIHNGHLLWLNSSSEECSQALPLNKRLSPHAYLLQLRLQHARKLFDENKSIADTVISAGFSDQSHLTRKFKHRYGLTPGAYKKQKNL